VEAAAAQGTVRMLGAATRKARRAFKMFLLLHALPKLSAKVWRICPLTARRSRG